MKIIIAVLGAAVVTLATTVAHADIVKFKTIAQARAAGTFHASCATRSGTPTSGKFNGEIHYYNYTTVKVDRDIRCTLSDSVPPY